MKQRKRRWKAKYLETNPEDMNNMRMGGIQREERKQIRTV